MAAALSLLAGGRFLAPEDGSREGRRAALVPSGPERSGEGLVPPAPLVLPGDGRATLHELFAPSPRDGGWAGFLGQRVGSDRPWLWVQERMAILESGRLHPPAWPGHEIIHVEARDARGVLWAMEEGLRCAALGAVIGETWGDPTALDFTATRRLAVAAERHGVAAYLIRLGGHANLSGARFRWRLASAPSLPHPFNPKAPGAPRWDAELFRARGGAGGPLPKRFAVTSAPGRWSVGDEGAGAAADGGVVAGAPGRTLDQGQRGAA